MTPAVVLLAMGLLAGVSIAPAAEVLLFGPATYMAGGRGGVNTYTATVSLPADVRPPYRLRVENGIPAGTNPIAQGTISLNGALLIPSVQGALVLEREVALQTENTLALRFKSLAGTGLTVTIWGSGPPPTLTRLAPPTLPITAGAWGTLTATLSAADPTGTVLQCESSDPAIVAVPATVPVPAGEQAVPIAVAAGSPGTARITATLAGSRAVSHVTVVPPPAQVAGLAPPVLPLTSGSTGTLAVILNASQPTDTTVALTTSAPAIVGLPGAQVVVPAHTATASVTVAGLAPGAATVTASLHGTSATTAITVQWSLPAVQTFTCPASLIAGGPGACTVLLNASQKTETVLPLTSSDAEIATVPESVTIPAGHIAVPVPVAALAPGAATLTAGPLNGSGQSATVAVLLPPATLAGLTPNPVTLAVGATTILTLSLNAAPAGNTSVPLTSSPAGIVSLPAAVTVPAGESSVPMPLTAILPGTMTVTAGPLGASTVEAMVTVAPTLPTVTGLAPHTRSLPVGSAAPLTLTIVPTQATTLTVPLASSDPATVEVPSSVPVPAGSATAPVPVIGRNVGAAAITAGPLNGTSAQASITVGDLQTTRFTITPAAATIATGETQPLQAIHAYSSGVVQDETLWSSWTSSHPAIAKVVAKGKVTGLSPGTVTITAKSEGGGTATAVLTVGIPSATLLAVTPAAPTLSAGGQLQLYATATFVGGSTQDVTSQVAWTSSDPAVATVAASGLATALAPGAATLTAQLGTVAGTATVTVTPPPLVSLTLRPTAAVWSVGNQVQFRAIGVQADGTLRDVTAAASWASGTSAVASMTSAGVATTLAPGTTAISATHPDGVAATTTLTVILPPPAITALIPETGPSGTVVDVFGMRLDTATAAAVNGTPASITVRSDTHLTATIPGGASSGPITVTTLDGLATSPLPFVLTTAPTLTITSPVAGATIEGDRVLVRGTVHTVNAETGVEVNGVPAHVNGTAWAVEVPLGIGDTTLTATAMDATGAQATATVPVTVTLVAPGPLVFRAVPRSGVTPLAVSWQLENRTGRTLVQVELDPTGSGTFESPVPTLDGIRTTYGTAGLFAPMVRATDDQGQVYLAQTLLNVLDRAQVDAHLQARWAALKTALQSGAIDTALGLFLPSQVERYRTLFTALHAELPQIAHEMADIHLVTLTEQRAKYRLRRTELYAGQWVTLTYYLYFVQDATGAWAIEGF